MSSQPNIRFFVDHGVRRHFQQTNTGPGHEFSELKSYLLARLLWDPETDADAVDGRFPQRLLRPGRTASSGATSTPCTRRSGGPAPGSTSTSRRRSTPRDYLSAADVALYNALFDKAEAAAAGDPVRPSRGSGRPACP